MPAPAADPGADALTGWRIVVTRARSQASTLVTRLSALGAAVVELPVIAVEDPVDGGAALGDAADRVVTGAYDWVVVTSTNAVARAVDALGGRPVPAATRWAAVGRSTARALEIRGVIPALVPAEAVSEALVADFPTGPEPAPVGRGTGAVLFVRAERVRDVVVPGLAAKGWLVDDVVAYRTAAGPVDDASVGRARSADAVTFTSSSTVERTVEILGLTGVPPVVVSIGPVTSASARAAGLAVTAEATDHTLDGLVAALVAAVSGRAPPGEPEPEGPPGPT